MMNVFFSGMVLFLISWPFLAAVLTIVYFAIYKDQSNVSHLERLLFSGAWLYVLMVVCFGFVVCVVKYLESYFYAWLVLSVVLLGFVLLILWLMS